MEEETEVDPNSHLPQRPEVVPSFLLPTVYFKNT